VCVVQAAIAKKYCDEQLPGFLKSIETLLTQHKSGDGFFVGDKVHSTNNAAVRFFHSKLISR